MRKEAKNRRETDSVVIFSVEMFEKAGRTPPAAENDEGLLVGVERELWAGMAFVVGDVVERPGGWKE